MYEKEDFMNSKIVFTILLISLSTFAFGDWTSIGPNGGQIYCGAISSDSLPVIYVVPTNYPTPLLKTIDRGQNWTNTAGSLFSYPNAIAVDPTDANIVYTIISSQCYKTTNGGTSWTQYSIRTNAYFDALVINPLNNQVLFAGGYAYDGSFWRPCVARSTNAGEIWTVINTDTATSSYNYSVAIDPVDTTIVYAGGYANSRSSFYKSTDRGETWTRYEFPTDVYYVYSLHVSPLNHNIILAGALQGIMRSTDGGQTWTRQVNNSYNYSMSVAPEEPNVIYTGSYTTVYHSNDTGRTWVSSGTGIFGSTVRCVLADPQDNGTVYCGTTAGMFKSTDYGVNWQEINNGILVGEIPVTSIMPSEPHTVYVQATDNAIFKSTDDGNTWQRQPVVLSCGNVCNICFDPVNPLRIWMFEGSG
jgi:photosystem II stability/assembly factor-like uncharacterized protein